MSVSYNSTKGVQSNSRDGKLDHTPLEGCNQFGPEYAARVQAYLDAGTELAREISEEMKRKEGNILLLRSTVSLTTVVIRESDIKPQ